MSSSSEREACHEWRCGAGGRGHGTGDRGQVDVGEKEAGRNVRFTRASDGREKTSCQPPGAHSGSFSAHNHACIGD